MGLIHSTTQLIGEQTAQARLARVTFFVYFFFILFGTTLPFQEELHMRNQLADTNRINQLLSVLFLFSMVSIIGNQSKVVRLIKEEKFLTFFLLWTLLSVFWSPYPITSFKRWVAIFGEVVVIVAALIHFRWSDVALRQFRILMGIFLGITILSIALVPEAIEFRKGGAWRGITASKNNLGQAALFLTITWAIIYQFTQGKRISWLYLGLTLVSLIVLIGSRSTTCLLVFMLLLFLALMLRIGKLLGPGRVARIYALTVVFTTIGIGVYVLAFEPSFIAQFVAVFGKDLTFSGRTDLWMTVIRLTEDRLLQGWGFAGFWVMDGPHLLQIFQEFVWIPNQSHQGYIDLMNQTGVVGLVLFILMVLGYFLKQNQLQKKQIWIWFVIAVLFLNLQESTLFRQRHLAHFIFIFGYLSFFVDLSKERMLRKPLRNPVPYPSASLN